MNRATFLTIRWNNGLSLGLGIPALVYVGVVALTTVLSISSGFWGLVIISSLY